MNYRKCGESGVRLPEISLGLWHNFGDVDDFDNARKMLLYAFDNGICHFDLANNYGPTPGSAEITFGKVLSTDLAAHRDEIFVSSKAGFDMWPGVYGSGSSRKSLIASCDQSLKRTGLEYFDVFYSHCYDGFTPVEETMQALIDIVRSGKALYAGISNYPVQQQRQAYELLRQAGVPCLLSQYRASIFNDSAINENFDPAAQAGSGLVCYSPLAQGLLTDRYLNGIPADSRAARSTGYLQREQVTLQRIDAAKALREIAINRGQSLAQMAVAWLLADSRVTSVIVGASSVDQIRDNIQAIGSAPLCDDELRRIHDIASAPGIRL